MKYKYKPIEQARVGDIVEADDVYNVKAGELRQVTKVTKEGIYIGSVNKAVWSFGYGANDWKLIETLPGKEAKQGDTVICVRPAGSCNVGTIFQVARASTDYLYPISGVVVQHYTTTCSTSWPADCFHVLQLEHTKDGTQQLQIPAEATVRQSNDDQVYYKNGFARHRFDLRPVRPTPGPRETQVIREAINFFNQQKKETQMEPQKVTIEIDATMLKQSVEVEKYKSPLESVTKNVLLVFNPAGEIAYSNTAATAEDIKTAKVRLQQPTHLGYTIRIYKFSKGFTTSVPIIETK